MDNNSSRWKKLELFFEFLIFGIAIGIIEDIIAIKLTTGEAITGRIVGIIVLIAIPFAVLGEIIVDKIDFVAIFKKFFKKDYRLRREQRNLRFPGKKQ
ncbi:MAG TPA: hypothetical protein VJK26_00015 [Patescibacteria group bacterium]|nr:hypothetical protein [Patescibacteria group bacterium]